MPIIYTSSQSDPHFNHEKLGEPKNIPLNLYKLEKMAIKDRLVIALIPARSGSKGVSGKNMRKVAGVPLIDYTLRSALDSKYVDLVYVSSDDKKTLLYAKELGVTPIKRPNLFSGDSASANSVIGHFLTVISDKIRKKNPYIAYLQPTSPLRTGVHIDDAIDRMVRKKYNKLISVSLMTISPFKAFVLDAKGGLSALFGEKSTNMCRQNLPQAYTPNGAIYLFLMSDFEKTEAIPSNGSYPYIMNEVESLDIDTEDDFETLLEFMQQLRT